MAWVNVPALARERCAISLRRSPSSSHKIEHFSSSQAVAASEWSFLGGSKRVCLCMPPTGLSFGRGVTATRQRLLVFVANASQPEKPEGEGDDDEAGDNAKVKLFTFSKARRWLPTGPSSPKHNARSF
ncbi:hypothetical protein CBR_g8282 [Chara braunii]|uniref:Uncharacterized protein n=1 Tax=Chara braunii TaxID=69332 RepID=A0A388KLR5_CHABU|nr:hypothetical protein CBR_g8282 [Chara braunii]|eukprot:GBG70982.1 hypothetical protein CBR_g8282 [Chara braunii]